MEHVQYDEKETTLAHQVLKPGGHLLIFVPALSWLYSDFDKSLDHFRRYNKTDGIALLKKANFEVIEAKYMDFPGIFPWLILMKWMGRHLSPGKVSIYDKYIIPLTRLCENAVTPPIGKNLLLIGKKLKNAK